MTYSLGSGIAENQLSAWLKTAAARYGTFADGRVDYTGADTAPIVMCTLCDVNEILLVKRGQGLADAEGYWSTINGFIDEDRPVKEIAAQELKEELGLTIEPNRVMVADSYLLKNPAEKRAYIVFPCLIKFKTRPEIKLDWEHTEHAWIKRSDLDRYHILDDLHEAIDRALSLG